MTPELLESRNLTPRRRFRGKRRYFRRIAREAREFDIRALGLTGFDYWHYHADWPGWGNRGWRFRLEHVRALAVVFEGITRRVASLPGEYQLWINLSGRDAGEDAVFLHTATGSDSPFPLELQFTSRRFPKIEDLFHRLLPGFDMAVRETRIFDEWAEPPRDLSSFHAYSPKFGMEPGAESPGNKAAEVKTSATSQ